MSGQVTPSGMISLNLTLRDFLDEVTGKFLSFPSILWDFAFPFFFKKKRKKTKTTLCLWRKIPTSGAEKIQREYMMQSLSTLIHLCNASSDRKQKRSGKFSFHLKMFQNWGFDFYLLDLWTLSRKT